MTVIAARLAVVDGQGQKQAPLVLLRDELERTAIAAPLCMWPVSLCTQNSEQSLHVISRALSRVLPLCSRYAQQAAKQPAFVHISADCPAKTGVESQRKSSIYSFLTFKAEQICTATNPHDKVGATNCYAGPYYVLYNFLIDDMMLVNCTMPGLGLHDRVPSSIDHLPLCQPP